MKIIYIEDLHIPRLGDWSPDAAGDWLHPLCGPLPDHIGLLGCAGHEFMAALWDGARALTVMLERLDQESTDPLIPLRQLDEVYITRGWIIQSYQWVITPSGLVYSRHKIKPREYEDSAEWREEIYRSVMVESVKICANFPGE